MIYPRKNCIIAVMLPNIRAHTPKLPSCENDLRNKKNSGTHKKQKIVKAAPH